MLSQGETRKLPIIYKISMQMQPQCFYGHQQADKEYIFCKRKFFIFITNTWKYQLQCNQANYIRFLVHFVTAGPIINIKFNRERDFNACALYY